MAPTTTELKGSAEEEGPNSSNIWDKTFQICDRYDSDASMIFTDVTDDPGAFAASQQDTLDSFYAKGESTPTSSPQRVDGDHTPNHTEEGVSHTGDVPSCLTPSPLSSPAMNGAIDLSKEKPQVQEKPAGGRDSHETISVLSTTAVAGSVASLSSLDREPEAKESRLLMEMKDLAHSPPSEEDHKSETKADGLESSIGQELAVPSRHKNSSVDAAGKSTEDEAVEITNRATSESGTNIATEISIATPRQQKEEERAPSAGTLRSPAEDESEATQETLHTPAEGLVKAQDPPAAPMTDSKQQVKSITSSPIQGADSPPTPETITPRQGDIDESSQDSEPTQISTPPESASSLNPISEPFVPSKPKQEVTAGASKASSVSSKALSASAAAFVPSSQPANHLSVAASGSKNFQHLQFGDLPESLNASPHPGSHEQTEWPSQYSQFQGSANEQGEWSNWGDYKYSEGYAESGYGHPDDNTYYSQADGSWGYWDPQLNGGTANSWGYEEEGGYSGYANGYGQGTSEGDDQQLRRKSRGPRTFRRGQGRRQLHEGSRGGWGDAAVDVLEQQFGYSRDSLQEMLDLHEGNLEVALDMLAQLEAEHTGDLPASGQDAPELNEENFPSLGSNSSSAGQQPAPARIDFAAAVKTPGTPSPATPEKASPATQKSPHSGANGGRQPWAETGAAVTKLYEESRADARDHARLRNQYFQEATKAYMAGNKALAKQLGAKGREHSDHMKAAHVAASQVIYKHRNPGRSKGRAPGLVDLHGLHVKEGLAMLEEQVEAVRRSKPKTGRPTPQRLSVLVGTGHHTKGVRTPARLPAAIEEWLKASQIPYSAPEPGILELTV